MKTIVLTAMPIPILVKRVPVLLQLTKKAYSLIKMAKQR